MLHQKKIQKVVLSMTKFLSISFLLTFFITTVYAQNFPITGTIKDSINHEPLIGVNVILTNQNDSEKKYYTVTDIEGNFQFPGIIPASYFLSATYVGYSEFTQAVQVSDKLVSLGNIFLSPSVEMMDALVITGKVNQSVQLGDTTQFNAGAFKTTPDASGQDLVEKLPGITIVDGKLQAQGEDVQQILVDGKPFFGGDVDAALQNLPAEVIASIQVYDKKSDKAVLSGFDDGERTKTINIITKPNRRKGQFGKTSAGYGSNDRYQLGGSVNLFNEDKRITITGLSNNINTVNYSADPNSQGDSRTQNGIITTNNIGVNFSNDWGDKIEVSGSYLFSNRQNEGNASIIRDYVLPSDSGQVYTEDRYNTRINRDHRLNMRFEYNIDSSNRIIIRPGIALKHDENSTYFLGRTVTDYGPLNQTENTLTSDNSDYDFDNRMYYGHKFKKKGRSLTLGINTGYHTNEDNAYRQANNVFYQSEDSLKILNQNTIRNRTGLSWETDVSYTEPIGKNGMVELEYEIGNRIDDSDKLTYDIYEEEANSYNLIDTALSNTFNSEYLSQEAEIGYQYATEKLRVQVEAEFQQADLKNDQEFPKPFNMERTFRSVLPTVRFDYEFSQSSNIEIDYDTWTSAPSIGQLQDVIDNSNPLQLRTGNPDLDQSFNNRIRVRYRNNNSETEKSFFVYLASTFIENNIANSSTIAEETIELSEGIVLERGSQLARPVNIDGYWDFRSYVSYGQPIDLIKSNLHLHSSVNYTKRPGMINNEINFVNSGNYRAGVSLSSNISEKVDFRISTRSSYNTVENSLRPELSNNFFNQTTRLSYDWIFWKGFVYRVDLNHQFNQGLAKDYDNSFLLMNMSLGKKFLKNQRAEVSLNVYDLFGQNNNIRRNVTELYVEDVQSNVLQRYFMLTLTYNIRHFSKGTSMSDFEDHY